MGKVTGHKKKTNLSGRKKKGVDMTAYAGKVKVFQKFLLDSTNKK